MNAKSPKPRLLLVEDNPGDVRLIEELLRDYSEGLKISVARSLTETYACLEQETYDAVLLDLNLPDSSGLNTVRALVCVTPATPIIVLTAMDNEELGLQAIQAGAQDYLPKSDISHSMLKRALRYGQQRMALQDNFRRLVEHNIHPTFVIGHDGKLRYENQKARSLAGYENLQQVTKTIVLDCSESEAVSNEIELMVNESVNCTFALHASPIDWDDTSGAYLISMHDVTETKRVQMCLEESNKALQTLVSANADTLRLSSKILESMTEGVIVTDAAKRITAVNPAFTRLTGYGYAEVIGNTPEMLQSGLHGKQFYKVMSNQLKEYGHWQGEIWNQHKKGNLYCVQESINAIYQMDGTVSHYVSIMRDITARVEREKVFMDQALHDSLTGLANRNLLKETLQQHILLAGRKGYKVGILFIDVDNFKAINDAFGHMLGDWLLCELATRMSKCARASDLVARLGGDEFVIVLPDVTGISSVETATDHIMSELSKPYAEQGASMDVSFSIGISIWPDHGQNTDELLERADLAMYEVKRSGKGNWRMAKQFS